MLIQKILQVFLLLIFPILAWDPLVGTGPSHQTLLLFNKLSNFNRNFFLSGQTSDYYDKLKSEIQLSPVVRGFDMQNYSPHNPWFNWQPTDDGTVSKAIEWYKSTGGKGIVTFHWHWFSPTGGELRTSTFYTNYTNFDVSKAVQSGTLQYNLTIRDIDAIAVQLKRLQSEKIPILWRPLHQAGGGWFWWGAKGATASKKLLDIIFQRLDKHHSINNLIWVWSTPEQNWYPGKQRVDIIGYDSYPGSHNYDCNLKMFMQLRSIVNATKIIALTENGPIPDVDKCYSSGAMWSYFMSWSNLVDEQNTLDHIKAVYHSSKVKTIQNI